MGRVGHPLLVQARAAGLTVTGSGADLIVRGARRHESLVQHILAARAEVLAALADEEDAIRRRTAELAPLIPVSGPVPVVTLVRGAIPPGHCLSCGAALAPSERWRCGICVTALQGLLAGDGGAT